jgi:hypothetical protein
MSGDTRLKRVVLETERLRIEGEVTLPVEGYRSRLSDLLNREGVSFIALEDVEVNGLNGRGGAEQLEFIAVARDHIQVAYEANGARDVVPDLEDSAPADEDEAPVEDGHRSEADEEADDDD